MTHCGEFAKGWYERRGRSGRTRTLAVTAFAASVPTTGARRGAPAARNGIATPSSDRATAVAPGRGPAISPDRVAAPAADGRAAATGDSVAAPAADGRAAVTLTL